jgi:hypothetical protein
MKKQRVNIDFSASEVQTGVCLCLLNIGDILSSSKKPSKACKEIWDLIDTAIANAPENCWEKANILQGLIAEQMENSNDK